MSLIQTLPAGPLDIVGDNQRSEREWVMRQELARRATPLAGTAYPPQKPGHQAYSHHMFHRLVVLLLLALPMGCAVQPLGVPPAQAIEVAFSPEAGAEALVLKVIEKAQSDIHLAGYSFTSPAVVRGLIEAKRRGVNVRVVLDDHGNRGKANIAAMNLLAGADIPIRVTAAYAIHHDKYIIVDKLHTETGSFNYSQAASRSNSENVIVVWNNSDVARRYLQHWENRWLRGTAVEQRY